MHNLQETIREARTKYLPQDIKCLLVAEAPPDSIERFFYYEDVRNHDGLFLGVTEVLYPHLKVEYIRKGRPSLLKKKMLEQFQNDGFYLMDLVEVPMSVYKDSLKEAAVNLVERVKNTISLDVPIVLIKVTTFDYAYTALSNEGFKKISQQRIPFPGSGQQHRFRKGFTKALSVVR